MTRLITLVVAAAFAIASPGAFAQGASDDAPKATPAEPAKAQGGKQTSTTKAKKTKKRTGDPKGAATGQPK
jgi:hypothetical protein